MSRFDDPQSFFEGVYRGKAPWDIAGPQPALTALFDAYPPIGPVLDLGCGTGDLALELGRRGLEVLGIDIASNAIERARLKASEAASDSSGGVAFEVADASRPALLGRTFGSVVDCGFYHLFGPDERERLIAELAEVIVPRGRFYLLAFAVEFDLPNTPRQVREEELRAGFTPERGWRLLELRSDLFLSNVAPPVPAIAACVERLPG